MGIKVPSLAINFGENGIIGTEDESAIEHLKHITDRGLELGANIITAQSGKIPDNEKSESYDKMRTGLLRDRGFSIKIWGSLRSIYRQNKAIVLVSNFVCALNGMSQSINFVKRYI